MHCTAVGDFDYQDVTRTLIESWNGTAWKVVPAPNRAHGAQFSILSGVSCGSAVTCSAVGNYGGSRSRKTLIELGTPAT